VGVSLSAWCPSLSPLLHSARHSGKRKQAAAERRTLARACGRRRGRRAAAAGGPERRAATARASERCAGEWRRRGSRQALRARLGTGGAQAAGALERRERLRLRQRGRHRSALERGARELADIYS
jgi:hypothetical protein